MIRAKVAAIANAITASPEPVTVTIYHDVDSEGYVDDDEHWTLADLTELNAPQLPLYPGGSLGGYL